MAKVIEVTPEILESTAGTIDGMASDYKNLYDKFYSKTNELSGPWGGKDQAAFISQIAGFKDDFERMHSLMGQYADFLRKSAKSYRATQEEVLIAAKRLTN